MAVPTEKTPGVYVQELSAFPNSVVEVPTAVPAFIGHTATAKSGNTDLTKTPTRITSMGEYLAIFANGVPPGPPLAVGFHGTSKAELTATSPYLLYQSLQLFYANGGGSCWIVSVGNYHVTPTSDRFIDGIDTLLAEREPTMIVTPGAVRLQSSDWHEVAQHALAHCDQLGSRVAILDILDGDTVPVRPADPITAFRAAIGDLRGEHPLSYGVAYWPWLNTTIFEAADVNYSALSADVRRQLATQMIAEAQKVATSKKTEVNPTLTAMIADVKGGTATSPRTVETNHHALDHREPHVPGHDDASADGSECDAAECRHGRRLHGDGQRLRGLEGAGECVAQRGGVADPRNQ